MQPGAQDERLQNGKGAIEINLTGIRGKAHYLIFVLIGIHAEVFDNDQVDIGQRMLVWRAGKLLKGSILVGRDGGAAIIAIPIVCQHQVFLLR